jgi:hypothetical protein
MTPEQSQLVLQILTRLEPYFAADDIRPCRFCGMLVKVDPFKGTVVEHDKDCVVTMIRALKSTMH